MGCLNHSRNKCQDQYYAVNGEAVKSLRRSLHSRIALGLASATHEEDNQQRSQNHQTDESADEETDERVMAR